MWFIFLLVYHVLYLFALMEKLNLVLFFSLLFTFSYSFSEPTNVFDVDVHVTMVFLHINFEKHGIFPFYVFVLMLCGCCLTSLLDILNVVLIQ